MKPLSAYKHNELLSLKFDKMTYLTCLGSEHKGIKISGTGWFVRL